MHAIQATAFTLYTDTDAVRESSGDPNDRDLATVVMQALHGLQDALDRAALAGLIVEPCFKRFPNRFKDRGSDAESYVAKVEIYRKLA